MGPAIFYVALFESRKHSLPGALGERALNLLLYLSAERGIPPIVIAPARSELHDNLNAICAGTLAAQIVPPITSTQPAVTVEERRGSGRIIHAYPVNTHTHYM